LVAFDLLCRLVSIAIFAPISAWFIATIIGRTGNTAVSNLDLVSFFLSPKGLLLVAVSGTASFAIMFFEIGGLVLIVLGLRQSASVTAVAVFRFLSQRARRLLRLGLRQFLILASLVTIVLVVAVAAKTTLLGGGDIYYYLQVRPSRFWWAIGIIGLVAVAAGTMMLVLLLRWIVALPILLLEDLEPREAMASSRRWVSQQGLGAIAKALGFWAISIALLGVFAGLIRLSLERLGLGLAGDRIDWMIGIASFMLAADLALRLIVAFVASLSLAGLIATFYCEMRGQAQMPISLSTEDEKRAAPSRVGLRVTTAAVLISILVGAFVTTYSIVEQIDFERPVFVTAHRGSSSLAPENTMSSLLLAIEEGADYAEIDVQETADGVVVLFHDTDLRRKAGVDPPIWEVSYEEFQQLDIGSWFSDQFTDERIATLKQAIRAAKGKIKLNIEMKFNGHDRQLEAEVVRLVREANFEDECIVTSLDLAGLQRLARLDESLRRGLIVTAKVGDATRLDVDLIAVNANFLTRDLVARARRQNQEVHVWTVNEPDQMLTMIHLGADNILTSSPGILIELLDARAEMGEAQKTLLLVSDFLAGRL
jgi:glycerophosphoryl diester phosphodiesterase